MFVTHLECARTGEKLPAFTEQHLSSSGAPLLVRYDLDQVRKAVDPRDFKERPLNMWRYRELLPFRSDSSIVSLGETMTPVFQVPKLVRHGGLLFVKDESRLPTGSFKARGLAMAVTLAKELGAKRMAIPTNGNAGAALASYCARGGVEAIVFCPDITPAAIRSEIGTYGATLHSIRGLINDCGAIVKAGAAAGRWYDCSTLREPYRVEGKKTLGFELAEQFDWQPPEVVIFPTGGGVGVIGLWKAFGELAALGWLRGPMPRLCIVQARHVLLYFCFSLSLFLAF
jgi:threonine synthase